MTRETLMAAVKAAKDETRAALQTAYDALNHGQQKQIVKNAAVKALYDLYGVDYGSATSKDE